MWPCMAHLPAQSSERRIPNLKVLFFFTFFAAETAEWRIAGPGQRVLLHRQWKMLLAGVLPR
jgi:hypothetical protein